MPNLGEYGGGNLALGGQNYSALDGIDGHFVNMGLKQSYCTNLQCDFRMGDCKRGILFTLPLAKVDEDAASRSALVSLLQGFSRHQFQPHAEVSQCPIGAVSKPIGETHFALPTKPEIARGQGG